MKRILTLLVALTVAAAFGGMTFAAEEKKAEPAKPAAAPAKAAEPAKAAVPAKAAEPAKAAVKTEAKGSGEVTAVDAKAMTITVKTKKGEVVIAITENSKITVGGKDKKLEDVKVGDKVKVTVAKPAKKSEKNPCAKNPCGKK